MESVTFSVVIPVYRNEGSVPQLLANLDEVARQLPGRMEVIFVVDGSPDRSFDSLRERLPAASFDSRVVLLSRNFGSFPAITAGLAVARGDYMAVIAADLQEPPELPVQFFQRLLRGDCDVVLGQRQGRGDPLSSRILSAIFWGTYRRFVQPEVPPGGIDVFACNRVVRDTLIELEESNTSLVGLLIWVGFRREVVTYRRLPRIHGKSSWGFKRKMRYLKDSIFAFSDLPLRLMGIVGAVGIVLSLVLALVIVVGKLTRQIEVPGYAAIMVTVVFFGGLHSLSLSLLGEYLWRCFENTKRRPRYIVYQTCAFEARESGRAALQPVSHHRPTADVGPDVRPAADA